MGAFLYSKGSNNCAVVTALLADLPAASKGIAMSTPWYEQIAQTQSAQERDEFVKGMFGLKTHNQHSFVVGLLAGYVGTELLIKQMKKSRREKNR
jgi:hypothetical protein